MTNGYDTLYLNVNLQSRTSNDETHRYCFTPLFPFASPQCSVTAYSENPPSAEVDGTRRKAGVLEENSYSSENPSKKRFSTPVLSHEFTVHVKYVRRELRNLTDRDREAFFNALSVIQRVPSAVGRVLFGEKYFSKDYMNRLHIYYGER